MQLKPACSLFVDIYIEPGYTLVVGGMEELKDVKNIRCHLMIAVRLSVDGNKNQARDGSNQTDINTVTI